ncbi:MAG: M23 family metallopeptidase [Polyangiales bacterium]
MEVFPVKVRPLSPDHPEARHPVADRDCMQSRIWFDDWHDVERGGGPHHAQDIFAPWGSPVLAPEDVQVQHVWTPDENPSGGHSLVAWARGGRRYYMSHLRDVAVRPGDVVAAGRKLGHVGRSGNAKNTCPHLHIGAREGGRPVNLYPELRKLETGREQSGFVDLRLLALAALAMALAAGVMML